MNDLLLALTNVIVALVGVVLMALAQRIRTRGSKFLTGLAGLVLLIVAILNLPSQRLSRAKPTQIVPPTPEPAAAQPILDANPKENQVIYVGSLEALADALAERLQRSPPEPTAEPVTSEDPTGCRFINGRRPMVAGKYILVCNDGQHWLALGEYDFNILNYRWSDFQRYAP